MILKFYVVAIFVTVYLQVAFPYIMCRYGCDLSPYQVPLAQLHWFIIFRYESET
jgi:hypothetical protein